MKTKRRLAMLITLVLLVALAVGLSSCQRGGEKPTPTTEAAPEPTNDATNCATEPTTQPEETTAPTEKPTEEPTEEPTTAPTEPEQTDKPDDKPAACTHDYKHTVIAPTTTAKGYTLHECKRCGHSYKDSYTDKLPTEGETQPSHSNGKIKMWKPKTVTTDIRRTLCLNPRQIQTRSEPSVRSRWLTSF